MKTENIKQNINKYKFKLNKYLKQKNRNDISK